MNKEQVEKYAADAHAMQSGVKMTQSKDINDGVPEDQRETGVKHLRVGINMAHADHGALVRLLLGKGIITTEEYDAALLDGAEREKKDYEKRLSERFGTDIKLA